MHRKSFQSWHHLSRFLLSKYQSVIMHKSSTFFDQKWKIREQLVALVLILLLLILTGLYMNLAPIVTRSDIMGIVYVSLAAFREVGDNY